MEKEKYVSMCVECRRKFTEEEIQGASCCPGCGSKGVPADPNAMQTATLTEHEWRILGIFASNWAEKCGSSAAVEGILMEVRRQNPEIGPLSMGEEFAGIQKIYPDAVMIKPDGTKKEGLN